MAGYSDNDWDIMPILEDGASLLDHILWIKYAPQADVDGLDREALIDQGRKELEDWTPKALQLVEGRGEQGVVLFGDPTTFLRDLCESLGVDSNPHRPLGSAAECGEAEYDPDGHIDEYIRWLSLHPAELALTLAGILGAREERTLLRPLLRRLHDAAPEGDHALRSECLWRLQGSYFMEGGLEKSLREARRSLSVLRRNSEPPPALLADKHRWIGFLYLSHVRPPHLGTPLKLILAPLRLLIGGYHLVRSAIIGGTDTEGDPVAGKARLTAIDYAHHLFGLSLLLGHEWSVPRRALHTLIDSRYRRLFKKYPCLATTELNIMRHMEAKVHAGSSEVERSAFHRELDIIEHSCNTTLNEHHLGNVFVFRALLHHSDGELDCAKECLEDAMEHWSGEAYASPSGIQRVKLYQRYFGASETRERSREAEHTGESRP